ncbi:MAG: alpha/beta hydrolase [Opitutaceae bacterium]|nr:alpha/beta hydrolase [Opitutaceae bacterium]
MLIVSLVLVAAYGFLLLYALIHGAAFVFEPPVPSYRDGEALIKVKGADGVLLSALFLKNPESRYTFFYFHGNGEDLGDCLSTMEMMRAKGYSVFSFDYRGYGTTPGVPQEANVYADAASALEYLTTKEGVDLGSIILYGRSLGSGPAVEMGTRYQVGGVILEGGFISSFQVVTCFPLIPFDFFKNLKKIGRLDCPLLIIHAEKDKVVGFKHGEKLYERAKEPKFFYSVSEAGHNDLIERAGGLYWKVLEDFIRAI